MNKFFILIPLFFISSFSQTFLSGEIKGVFPRDNYIISGDLSVKYGDTLIFEAGSELRFEPHTGLEIRGVFIALGTAENSIIFTSAKEQEMLSSERDRDSTYRWKGIKANVPMVKIRLSYCLFCFCESAIVIKNTVQEIKLDHVVFHKNKWANFIIAGKPVKTDDDVQYVYSFDAKEDLSQKHSFPMSIALDIGQNLQSRWKMLTMSTFSAVSLGGTGLWIYGYVKAKKFNKLYNKSKDTGTVVYYRERREKMVNLRDTGIAISMIGLGGVLITFIF